MWVRILQCSEQKAGNASAVVSYKNSSFPVVMRGLQPGRTYIGDIDVELDWDKVLNWQLDEQFSNENGKIWRSEAGIHLRGKVHRVIDIDYGRQLFEIRDDNRIVCHVSSDEIDGEILSVDDGLEIIVNPLYVFPTHTDADFIIDL